MRFGEISSSSIPQDSAAGISPSRDELSWTNFMYLYSSLQKVIILYKIFSDLVRFGEF